MNEFEWVPPRASVNAIQVDALFYSMVGFTALVCAGVAGAIVYFCLKYRLGSKADRRQLGRRYLPWEFSWTAIPLIIAIGLFFWGANLYFDMFRPPADAQLIYVVGKQWMWKFEHPEGPREINDLHLPAGRAIELVMTSQDVIHDVFIPAFRIHHDVLPGRYYTEWFTPTTPGRYHLFCSQFCGYAHAEMGGTVTVMPPADYAHWLARGNPQPSMAARGFRLFVEVGCSGCHGENAAVHAPKLAGLYGSVVHLSNGTTVIADDRYIHDHIVMPGSQVVVGYRNLMPSFKGLVTEDEILELVAYIKSLEPGERSAL
jgi:cytochrome c oxidase subunit 2